jgi:hypothetical protein
MAVQYEDIIMKNVMEFFKGDAVNFFGIQKRIIAVTRTELVHLEKRDDWVCETEDGELIHFEFQTTNKPEDLPRFMAADAILFFKEKKRVRTFVVYSGDIETAETTLDAGSIHYTVNAFYLAGLDGDAMYGDLRRKINAGEPLAKRDLMAVVLLPLMKSSRDKGARLTQAVELSKQLPATDTQAQIQAMLALLAEKFVLDEEQLAKLKEMINMTAIEEMIRRDDRIEVAKNLLSEGIMQDVIHKATGLPADLLRQLQADLEIEV